MEGAWTCASTTGKILGSWMFPNSQKTELQSHLPAPRPPPPVEHQLPRENKVISFLGHYQALLENSGWAVRVKIQDWMFSLSWKVCNLSLWSSQQGPSALLPSVLPRDPPQPPPHKPSHANCPLGVSGSGVEVSHAGQCLETNSGAA